MIAYQLARLMQARYLNGRSGGIPTYLSALLLINVGMYLSVISIMTSSL